MMLLLHERHEILPGKLEAFEEAVRGGWMPLLARGDDARLLWYWEHVHMSSRAHNVVTWTAIRDAAAWGRLAESMTNGDLAGWVNEADTIRRDVESNLLATTRWSELKEVDFQSLPVTPEERHDVQMYVEDVVWPPILDEYVEFAGEHWYRPAAAGTGKVRARITMPAFLQTAHGTGRRPEVYLIQRLLDPIEAFVRNLLATDYPPEMKAPDHYFVRGLKVRDQWESRIMRNAAWSPLE
jgi:hypothetical protein